MTERIAGWTKQELEAAHARWAEHRPERFECSTGIQVRQAAPGITQRRVEVKTGQVAAVSLYVPTADWMRPGQKPRPACTWEVPVKAALDVFDAMVDAFRDEELVMVCLRGYGGWESTFENAVWMHLRKRLYTD